MPSLSVYGDMLDSHPEIRKHGWEGWANRWQLEIDSGICMLHREQTFYFRVAGESRQIVSEPMPQVLHSICYAEVRE